MSPARMPINRLVLRDVFDERLRALHKHGEKSQEYGAYDAERRLRILVEEVGEVAKELNDAELADLPPDPKRLYDELIQVAASATAWADAARRTAEGVDQ